MKHIRKLTVIISAFAFLFTMAVISSQAQTRRVVRVGGYYRPTAVRPVYYRDPFWYGGYGFGSYGYYDPFYDPYFYDPYLSYQREKYYKEKDVRDARRSLAKINEKYRADGYLTAKEQKKLAERQEKYRKAQAKLERFNRNN